MTEIQSSDSAFRQHQETHASGNSQPRTAPASTAASTAISCRKCGLANPPAHRFCRQCGSILWRSCPQCANERPIDETFCASCGADLRSAEQQLVASCRQQLAEARQLKEQMDLHQAARVLGGLLGAKQLPDLEDVRQEAEKLLAEVGAERERQEQRAEVHLGRARILMDEHRYQEAAREIEQIPTPLREPPQRDLLVRAQAALAEIETLQQTVLESEGVALRDRLAAVERLLELLPENPKINRWATQIHDHILAAARKKIREHRYRDAVSLLSGITEISQSDASRKLTRQAEELAFLESELELAPDVDGPLLEAARRLLRVDETNATAKRALVEMKRRRQAISARPHGSVAEWTACPQDPSIGLPVHLLGELQRLQFASTQLKEQSAEHPGQYLVACGLALQALGRSAISIDLTPSTKSGVLGRLRSGLRERPVSSGWGLDIGNSSLKAVQLTVDQEDRIRVARCVHLKHRAHVQHAMPADTARDIQRETLSQFAADHRPEAGDRVITQWPAIASLIRLLNLPAAEGKKLSKLIQAEAQHQIPFPLSEVCWDSHTFPPAEATVGRQVLLLAAKLHDMQERLELLRDCDIEVHGVQCDAVALHNFVHHELWAEPAKEEREAVQNGVAVMDLGAEATNLIFSFPDFLWFRAALLGGDDLVTAFARRFKITHDVAERVKREPQRVKRLSDLYDESSLVYRKLSGQFESAWAELKKTAPQKRPQQLLLVGGSARSYGLLRYLRFGR